MKYVFILILCTLVALIISFRHYRETLYNSLSSKEAPLKLLYGFSMLIISLTSSFLGKSNIDVLDEKLKTKLKSTSFGICAFTIIIFFGLLYSITDSDEKPTKNTSITDAQPSLDIEVLDEVPENETDLDELFREDENYKHIKDAIAVFESHREDIEKAFLDKNESYLAVTKPLNLITKIGEENVEIFWTFEPDNVIDVNGNIIYENISSDGCQTLAYANLSLDDVTATLTIPFFISPP